MKDIKLFLEGRIVNEITIKDIKTNKEVNVIDYCYDKESLDKVIKQYEHVDKFLQDKGFFLATIKNKSTWVIDRNKEVKINTLQPNGDYIKYEDKTYNYEEFVELLEMGEIMLIIINKYIE